MEYLFLLGAMSFSAMITVGGRFYNSRNFGRTDVTQLYNVLVAAAASFAWLILWLTDFSFDIRVLPYSLLYGLCFTFFTVGMIGALSAGSTAVTGLVKQMALVGVSFWGFMFWDTEFTWVSGIGIALIVLSLALCLLTKQEKGKKGNLLKWTFYALLLAIGNAGASITQRYQQMTFDYQHKNMMMFFALVFATVFCLLLALRENKINWGAAVKNGWLGPVIAGCSSALSNVFILLLVKVNMSAAIMYPGIAVGGLMITTLISFVCFKERLRLLQWVGLAVGAVALVFLNL